MGTFQYGFGFCSFLTNTVESFRAKENAFCGVTWVVGRRGRGEEGLAARGSGGMVRVVGQRGRGEEGGVWHAVQQSEERAIHTGGRHAVVVALSRGTCSGVLNTVIAHSNMHRNPVSMKVQEIRGMLLAGCCATRCKSWWAMSGAKGTAFGMAQGDLNREKACAKRVAFAYRTRPRRAHDWCLVMRNVGDAQSCLSCCSACCAPCCWGCAS